MHLLQRLLAAHPPCLWPLARAHLLRRREGDAGLALSTDNHISRNDNGVRLERQAFDHCRVFSFITVIPGEAAESGRLGTTTQQRGKLRKRSVLGAAELDACTCPSEPHGNSYTCLAHSSGGAPKTVSQSVRLRPIKTGLELQN